MLGELERRLVEVGVHRVQCLLADDSDIGALALENAGYDARRGLVLYERLEPVDLGSAGILGQLGGHMVRPGAWDQLGGMVKEKDVIERQVIQPLAEPQRPRRSPPAPAASPASHTSRGDGQRRCRPPAAWARCGTIGES